MLNIADHFSKFCQAYLLVNKNKESILNKLKYYINNFGVPKEFGIDNGKEFINKTLQPQITEGC